MNKGLSFHLSVSSSNFFINVLLFSGYKSFSLLSLIVRHFILFYAVVNGIIFLLFCCCCCCLMFVRIQILPYFYELIFCPETLQHLLVLIIVLGNSLFLLFNSE